MDKNDFLKDLDSISLNLENCTIVSRAELVVPKLNYQTNGKLTEVFNYSALSKFTNRSLQAIGYFFASRLGVSYEISSERFIFKGDIKHERLRQIENKFYNEQVLCPNCKNPETLRVGDCVKCLGCQHNYKRKIKE